MKGCVYDRMPSTRHSSSYGSYLYIEVTYGPLLQIAATFLIDRFC
jgi:hypothetical protein